MKPRWKLHCNSGPAFWKLTWSSTLIPEGVKEAWFSHLSSCKPWTLGFMPLPPPHWKHLPAGIRAELKPLLFLGSIERERGRKSGAGPSLPQLLAQWLLCCSKVPEHASETPSFTARLAGPHTHTHFNRMLHINNQAYQRLTWFATNHMLNHPKFIYLVSIFCFFMLVGLFFFNFKWGNFQFLCSYSRFIA